MITVQYSSNVQLDFDGINGSKSMYQDWYSLEYDVYGLPICLILLGINYAYFLNVCHDIKHRSRNKRIRSLPMTCAIHLK